MTATYDPTTLNGQVRLLSTDTDLSAGNLVFQDEELAAFLSLNAQNVRLAAAQALDVIASSEVLIQRKIKTLDFSTDGPAEAERLQSMSAELRRQVNDGDGDYTGMFDWAEQVLDPFSERERLRKQFLRQNT